MAIGIVTTKAQLDAELGDIVFQLRKVYGRVERMRHTMVITPDAKLVAMGYLDGTAAPGDPNEVAIVKSAIADLEAARVLMDTNGSWVQADQLVGLIVE